MGLRWDHSQLSSGHQLKPLTQSCPSPAMASRNNFRRPIGSTMEDFDHGWCQNGGNVPWKRHGKWHQTLGNWRSLESRTSGFPWISRVTSYFVQGNNQFGLWCNGCDRFPERSDTKQMGIQKWEKWCRNLDFCHQIFSALFSDKPKKFDRKNRPGWFPTSEGMWSESPWHHRHLCRQFLPAGGPRGCSYSTRRMEASLQAIDSTPDVNPTHQGLLGSFGWHLDKQKYMSCSSQKLPSLFFSMFRCSKKGGRSLQNGQWFPVIPSDSLMAKGSSRSERLERTISTSTTTAAKM